MKTWRISQYAISLTWILLLLVGCGSDQSTEMQASTVMPTTVPEPTKQSDPLTDSGFSSVNLTFSARECSEDRAYDPSTTYGVRQIDWLDSTTVKIDALVQLNCAYGIDGGGYRLADQRLELAYVEWRPVGENGEEWIAKCLCAQELSFSIAGLPKRDYQPTLRKLKTTRVVNW